MSQLPDILMFMSDQHSPYFMGCYDGSVDTPNFDALSQEGVSFSNCYTPCPLCVPARMSMLSGLRPARTGIFTKCTLPDTTPTFLHSLVERGYETALVGRMHFTGRDQCHGFLRHLGGDMTPVTFDYFSVSQKLSESRGVYNQYPTFSGNGATSLSGGGISPVYEYDEHILKTALEYLSQEHEKPQFLCVSTYGPHSPYVAPPELYQKYLAKETLPKAFAGEVFCSLLKHSQGEMDEEVVKSCRAAYRGAIEHIDAIFGQVREAFETFADRRQRKKLICYTSDHGDQMGDRHIFGKETFYERSAKVPMIIAGDGIAHGKVKENISLMDLGPTFVELAGARPMEDVDGVSFLGTLTGHPIKERPVLCEYMVRTDGKGFFGPYDPAAVYSHGVMIKKGDYKYMVYEGYEDQEGLYAIGTDPDELCNLAQEETEVLAEFWELSKHLRQDGEAYRAFRKQCIADELLVQYEKAAGYAKELDQMRWQGGSKESTRMPEYFVLNPVYAKGKRERQLQEEGGK